MAEEPTWPYAIQIGVKLQASPAVQLEERNYKPSSSVHPCARSTKRGRPSNGEEKDPPPKKGKSVSARNPPVTVRSDKIDHWPENIEN
ncbi:hypothetical protein AVEN_114759-1, partial [Araneus ventricosus]